MHLEDLHPHIFQHEVYINVFLCANETSPSSFDTNLLDYLSPCPSFILPSVAKASFFPPLQTSDQTDKAAER